MEGGRYRSTDASDTDAELVSRFRAGDSEAVGDFLNAYGPLVRAHYRRKIGRSMRRLVDSQDLLSTIARRLCQRVQAQRVTAADTRQLWALVFRIGNDALVDRVRIISRLREIESADSPFVQALRKRLDVGDADDAGHFGEELAGMLDALESDLDRELLVRWLHGETLASVAGSLGLTAPNTRKRWERLRRTLRVHLEARDN